MASPASTAVAAGPNDAPRPVARRRPVNDNPLVQRQKRPRPAPGIRPSAAAIAGGATAIAPRHASTSMPTPPTAPVAVVPAASASTATTTAAPVKQEEEVQWQEYKLTTTKASLMKDLRYHVMRMQSKRIVNPLDSQEFTRPIKLHRRDPRAPLQGAKEEAAANAVAAAHKAAEEEEKAKNQAEQDKKDADKAAALEKIAPYGGAQKQKKNAFQKKTQQVYKSNDAEKKLRYEEFFPWFIEDFDNKNTWVGQLESSLSKGVFAMFVLDDGAFKMVPIEKWYKFTEKNKFKTMTSEEAEVVMKQNAKPPRWLMNRTEEKERERRTLEENARATKKLFTRKGDRLPKAETDADDLDFDDDQFADDEEAPIMEGEEHENKEIENRIKKEQLSANFFDARGEREYEEEEKEKKKLEAVRRKHGKKVKKALMNREGNYTYETDSDADPYASTDDDSDDEEEEARKQEEAKKAEEARKVEAAEKEALEKLVAEKAAEKAAAAAAAKAATTTPAAAAAAAPSTPAAAPSDLKTAKPVVSKKATQAPGTSTPLPTAGSKLKRSGSPNLSGIESGAESRKKPKKSQAPKLGTSTLPVGTDKKSIVKLKVPPENLQQISSSEPSPSPPSVAGMSAKKRKNDGNATADEKSGETSDGPGSKKQRIKLLSGGRSLSPSAAASRQGSPAPPAPAGGDAFITDEEIKSLLSSNPGGVTLKFIADKFKSRVRNDEVKARLVSSIKRLTVTNDKKTYHLKKDV
ncbi:uncharacterized protein H6S33_012587 [Morchella sextelata]|uniref:uncharacterized protein n=1 Tax=Morchella sextelata TaxID=1174677 RepID=UPI001D0376B8|nr:uncharacterized protein H6S33_012587 [Morchella sextelata]KAH0610041.1 hypothetical protein H6S33_012587 [Morchella sextelata]